MTKVGFADLTHTGQVVAANTFPLGISYVAAYAQRELGDEIDFEVFKYPDEFSQYLEADLPQIACFSSYSWNIRLGHEYARRIKAVSPDTITVFGGPNFPSDQDEQRDFLAKYSSIDCYLEFEGEVSFTELFKALKTFDFDWERFKSEHALSPNVRYLADGKLISGPLAPKIRELDSLPSPYLEGGMDKFFDDVLIPMIQTTRGCPYTCSFCWEGGGYFDKTIRYSRERIDQELVYMADRVGNVPDLEIVDANFGMFKQDVETARQIASIKEQHPHSWPKSIIVATAKNHKERTIELVEILGEIMPPKAAVQSTNELVLESIKRSNVSIDAIVSLSQAVEKVGGQSESEIILCLTGDSKQAHMTTVCDMLDANMTFIRMYQFMMLPGTQSSSKEDRTKYELQTRFRVLPRCFGTYSFRAENFSLAEIEEIVVGSNTMPYEDYQACRDFDLSVEIFNNDSIFLDLTSFLSRHDVKRSDFIKAAHEHILASDGVLPGLYHDFREEEKKNLNGTVGELEEFTQQTGIIERYVDWEYGTNELYKYRALAVFHHINALHGAAFDVARSLLKERGRLDEQVEHYLNELFEFSLMRKTNILDTAQTQRRTFNFDFASMMESNFTMDPSEVHRPDGIEVEVYHSDAQSELISGYIKQYGTTLIGLGRLLIRANMNRLYRSCRSDVTSAEKPMRSSVLSRNNLVV